MVTKKKKDTLSSFYPSTRKTYITILDALYGHVDNNIQRLVEI
jgi:hypothetical protein